MEYKLTCIIGVGQSNKFIPELREVCTKKKLSMHVLSLNMVNWLTCKFDFVLIGDENSINYLSGWIDGYTKSHEINTKKLPEKKLPSPIQR